MTMSLSIVIIVKDEAETNASQLLAEDLLTKQVELSVISEGSLASSSAPSLEQFDYALYFDKGLLKLCQQNSDDIGDVWVDFAKGKSAYRQKHQGKGKLPLSRACGIKQSHRPTIIDATAGLGQDAFVLAGLGCEVQCFEQQPILAALLADGILRARNAEPWLVEIMERLKLIQGQAELLLGSAKADIVYLDPMYPHTQSRKHAKVKKGMQMFRLFPGTASNEKALLQAALKSATDRVVVKRPDWANPLEDLKPSFVIPGKNHRYDVYKVDNNYSSFLDS
jgi:16S rRNA (guanine1516-N2)-methyltransferase